MVKHVKKPLVDARNGQAKKNKGGRPKKAEFSAEDLEKIAEKLRRRYEIMAACAAGVKTHRTERFPFTQMKSVLAVMDDVRALCEEAQRIANLDAPPDERPWDSMPY